MCQFSKCCEIKALYFHYCMLLFFFFNVVCVTMNSCLSVCEPCDGLMTTPMLHQSVSLR